MLVRGQGGEGQPESPQFLRCASSSLVLSFGCSSSLRLGCLIALRSSRPRSFGSKNECTKNTEMHPTWHLAHPKRPARMPGQLEKNPTQPVPVGPRLGRSPCVFTKLFSFPQFVHFPFGPRRLQPISLESTLS